MKKLVMIIMIAMTLACVTGCGSSREDEFKDALTEMKVEKAAFDRAVERFRKLGSDDQKKELESIKNAVVAHHKSIATSDLRMIQAAAEQYMLAKGKVPNSVSDLVGTDNFLKESPRDPWGNEYSLKGMGESCSVICAGPDGRLGTDDDIRF